MFRRLFEPRLQGRLQRREVGGAPHATRQVRRRADEAAVGPHIRLGPRRRLHCTPRRPSRPATTIARAAGLTRAALSRLLPTVCVRVHVLQTSELQHNYELNQNMVGKLKEKAEARKADANAEYRAEEDQIMADYGRVRFYKGDEAAREAEEGVKTRLAKADTLRRKQVRAIDHETSVAVEALESPATQLGKRHRCA